MIGVNMLVSVVYRIRDAIPHTISGRQVMTGPVVREQSLVFASPKRHVSKLPRDRVLTQTINQSKIAPRIFALAVLVNKENANTNKQSRFVQTTITLPVT